MTDEQLDHAFSPEVEAEMAREWIASLERPLEAGLKPRRDRPTAKKTTACSWAPRAWSG